MPSRLAPWSTTLWTWFAHASAIALIAGSISFALLYAFASSGAVVVVTQPAQPLASKVKAGETLTYAVSTKRVASCGGFVTSTFTRQDAGHRETVVFSRPILSTEIRDAYDATVRIVLPDAIVPGRWLYSSSVTSRCPTYSQVDPVARFPIEVTP